MSALRSALRPCPANGRRTDGSRRRSHDQGPGVDAGAGEWLGIRLVDGHFAGAELQPSVADLLRRFPDVGVVAVDIPIGLPLGQPRPADMAARVFVGAQRAASVFSTLPLEVLAAPTYLEADEIAVRLLGKSLSRQSYVLRARIFEVAEFAGTDDRIIEVHPEVSFRALKGEPLVTSSPAASLAQHSPRCRVIRA